MERSTLDGQEPLRPREALGKELRALRVQAGLTGTELAALIGVTQVRVSRVETARFRPDPGEVDRWLTATGANKATQQRIRQMTASAVTEVTSYRAIFRGSLLNAQQALLRQDAKAQRIRHFQPFMVPGMFHTAAYARAALLAVRTTEEGVDEAVDARLERGRRLRSSGAPEYHAIVTEAALRWQPLSFRPADRDEVWRQMLAGSEPPNITVQVIPTDTPMRQAPMCAFMITSFRTETQEPTLVQVELPAVEMSFSGSDDVAAYETVWQRMADAALSPQESAELIAGLLRQ
ncbi:helix-turn-helix domain-containing protein [Micromonospora sp. STR1s_5]|nr:helix-turn-helix domain-containing protein [Micromonospora sp. STR1s_5]MBM0201941.1 helix-turn-helix domain-containing protein [Micromonospora sp. STR1s_5]